MELAAKQNKITSESKNHTNFFGKKNVQPFFSPAPARIQPKLTIGPVDDPYEQEADSVADRVMRMPENPARSALFSGGGSITTIQRHCAACEPVDKLRRKEDEEEEIIQTKPGKRFDIQRKCATCEEEDARIQPKRNGLVSLSSKHDPLLQRKCAACEQEEKDAIQPKRNNHVQLMPARSVLQRKCNACEQEDRVMMKGHATASAPVATPAVHQVLNSPGKPMDKSTRLFMESRFGYDFGNVQIHNDALAHTSSAEINALAYTYGNHVVFGNGQYQPETYQGRKLLAHELVHALQQTNPTARKAPDQLHAGQGNYSKIVAPQVQRFIFWNQYKAGLYNRKGQETHEELEGLFEAQGIQTEVSIPNGNANGVGFDSDGRADLYQSNNDQVPGVTFKKPAKANPKCPGIPELGTPAKLKNKGSATKNPRLDGKDIVLDGALSNIQVGDIKPAEQKSVDSGKTQVSNYQKGLTFFNQQVNCFTGGTWSLTPAALNPKLPTINNNPLRDLGISDFNLVADRKNGRFGAETKKVFSPNDLNTEIKGRLHIVNISGGVIAYFYYPDNLSALLERLELGPGSKTKNKLLVGYIELATELQDRVLFPLTAPPTVAPKRVTGEAFNQAGQKALPPAVEKNSSKQVQRVPKTPAKLVDNFKYAPWSENLSKYKKAFKQKEPKIKQSLEFLEQIYDIQEGPMMADAKKQVQGQGKPLPPKSSFAQQVGGKEKGTKPTAKNLTSIYSWMKPWATNPLYDKVGFFREKLGSGFVTVLAKLNKIKEKITGWIHKTVGKRAAKEPSKSTAAKIIRTLGRAVVALVTNILPQSLNLVVNAIKAGVEKKVKSVFEESFIGKYLTQFKEWANTVKNFVENPKDFLGDTVNSLVKDAKWVAHIFDNLSWLTPILKAAKCLSNWRKCAIDFVRSKAGDANILLCLRFVQKRIMGFMMGISFFKKLPTTLANLALEQLQGLMPAEPTFLKEILSERAPAVDAQTDDPAFLCEGTPDGGGLFKLDSAPSIDGGAGDEKAVEDMSKLMEQMSEEEIEEMLKKAREKGMMDKPFDQEKLKDLKKEFDKEKAGKDSSDKATDKPGKPTPKDQGKGQQQDQTPKPVDKQDKPASKDQGKGQQQDQGRGQQQDQTPAPVDKPGKPTPKDQGKGQQQDQTPTPVDKPGKPAPGDQGKGQQQIGPGKAAQKDDRDAAKEPAKPLEPVPAPYSGKALRIGVWPAGGTGSNLRGPESGSGVVAEKFSQVIQGGYCRGLGLTMHIVFFSIDLMPDGGRYVSLKRPSTLPSPTFRIKAMFGSKVLLNESGSAPFSSPYFIPPFGTYENGVVIRTGDENIKEREKNIIQIEIVLDDKAATNTILTFSGTVEYTPHPVPTCT